MPSPSSSVSLGSVFWTYAAAGGAGMLANALLRTGSLESFVWGLPPAFLSGGIAVLITRTFGVGLLGRIVGTYLLTSALCGLLVALFALGRGGPIEASDLWFIPLGAVLGTVFGSPVLIGFVPTALVLELALFRPDATPSAL